MHTIDAAYSLGRKIGCFIPGDLNLGEYDGNVYMAEEKGAAELRNTEDLEKFLMSEMNYSR